MDVQTTKLELIQFIASLQSEALLAQFQQWAKQVKGNDEPKQSNNKINKKIYELAAMPLEKIDLQQLKKQQGYQPAKINALRGQWFQDDDYFELLKLLN